MSTKFLYGIRITAIGFLLSMGWAGCDDDPVNRLEFSNDNLLLKAAGDTAVIEVTAGSAWTAESMADWCVAEETSDGKLMIRVTPSDDIYERGTSVKVSCGSNVVRLSIRQKPMVFEIIDGKKTLNFDKRVASDILKIHTNMSWKVEIADTTGWLQTADTAGNGDAKLTFVTTDNSQEKGRSTTVRLRYGIRNVKLTASQDGGIRADGHIQKHLGEREPESGFNLVFLGDGFIDRDLVAETGIFDKAVEEACDALFGVEPYKTYKEYFNVYSIACESKERGCGTSGETPNTVFASSLDPESGEINGARATAFKYAGKILGMTDDILKNQTAIVVLVNDERYGGTTYWYEDGRTVCFVPLNRDEQLPGGFANIFLHEVGGHGIGKLADEWCEEGNEMPQDVYNDINTKRKYYSGLYYYYNIYRGTSSTLMVVWGSYSMYPFSDEKYSMVNCYDGGLGFVSKTTSPKRCIYHSEEKSCMINHLPYFSAACRYAIMMRVLGCLGEVSFSNGTSEYSALFLENDKIEIPDDQPVSTDRPHLPLPKWPEDE